MFGDTMARKARKDLNTNVFSISQQSDEKLFMNNDDRDAFINIIQKAQQKFGFLVFAYCLLDDYQFKLVIDTKKQSISRIMQSIAVAYSHHRKTKHKLFPRRFKSIPLYSKEEVLAEINSIHIKGDSVYNSYCAINKDFNYQIAWLTPMSQHAIEFVGQVKESTEDELNKTLTEFLKKHDCDMEKIQADKELRNQCIVRLRQETNCSLKQIGYLFGGLSESTISKILKNREQDT